MKISTAIFVIINCITCEYKAQVSLSHAEKKFYCSGQLVGVSDTLGPWPLGPVWEMTLTQAAQSVTETNNYSVFGHSLPSRYQYICVSFSVR